MEAIGTKTLVIAHDYDDGFSYAIQNNITDATTWEDLLYNEFQAFLSTLDRDATALSSIHGAFSNHIEKVIRDYKKTLTIIADNIDINVTVAFKDTNQGSIKLDLKVLNSPDGIKIPFVYVPEYVFLGFDKTIDLTKVPGVTK